MEDVTRLLIARHPETEGNIARRFISTGDTPYTALGRRQADALTEAITAFSPNAVFSSPRRRCAEVARRAAEAVSARLTETELLAEIDFGKAEGLTYSEASESGVFMDLLGGPADEAEFEGGEPWSAFEGRIAGALGMLAAAGPRVAVITHSGPVRCLLTVALKLPSEAAWRFAVAPASVTLLTLGEDFAVLEAFGLPPEAVAGV